LDHYANGKESVLIESPVGSGKTIMGLLVIRKLQDENPQLKVNWVASRKHILAQTDRVNQEFFHCRINLVSVFNDNPPPADMVVLDEAHHEATQSCLDMYEKTRNHLTLGLSATPLRTDKMRLSFQETVRTCSIQTLIKQGVLSQYCSYKLPYWNVDLAAKVYCQSPERWGKTLVFFNTIAECRMFSERLKACNIPCEVVSSNSRRDRQLDLFINGDLQVIANVSVLSEGFDLPELQSVLSGGDRESVELCYDLAARLINCNRSFITVTAEELRKKYGLDLEGLVVFYSAYADFIQEINSAKN
jgi:superfamily II DNA or RNA helicase